MDTKAMKQNPKPKSSHSATPPIQTEADTTRSSTQIRQTFSKLVAYAYSSLT